MTDKVGARPRKVKAGEPRRERVDCDESENFAGETLKWRGFLQVGIEIIEMAEGFWPRRTENVEMAEGLEFFCSRKSGPGREATFGY